jgi:L-alanine-DL-glutamate epimerase-like enolase superfamily enzyme
MCAVSNCRYFEMLAPPGIFDFGCEGLRIDAEGLVHVPDRPGLGQVFDEEALESATTLLEAGGEPVAV